MHFEDTQRGVGLDREVHTESLARSELDDTVTGGGEVVAFDYEGAKEFEVSALHSRMVEGGAHRVGGDGDQGIEGLSAGEGYCFDEVMCDRLWDGFGAMPV